MLVNLSASNITIGKADYRRTLVHRRSRRAASRAYLYSAAGLGESTTDLAWDGQALIYENGDLLAESERFALDEQMIAADVDLGRVVADRMRSTNSFGDRSTTTATGCARSGASSSSSARRPRRVAAARARSSASRTCPPTRPRATSAATRSTTSRSRAGEAAARDRDREGR